MPEPEREMRSIICVHESFDQQWPWSADYWRTCWQASGCELYRSEAPDARVLQFVRNPETVQRLVLLGFPAESADLAQFTKLDQLFYTPHGYFVPLDQMPAGIHQLVAQGIEVVLPRADLFWGQSVAEFGLALTLCGLRRIPQLHHEMMQSLEPWNYRAEIGKPGQRGGQYGDDSRFTNGTIAGKRIRIVGAGNIGARYAKWCAVLGADVAIWDPYAPDATFSAARAKRCFHLSELVREAEIFVPMLPLKEDTRGLVPAKLINSLPYGSLVVLVTRAAIVDTEALYKRVLNNELSLAADVFDSEPVPMGHQLLGRENVVHTPHNAGRTKDANQSWVDDQIARFKPGN